MSKDKLTNSKSEKSDIGIFIFRRDLRIEDNRGLINLASNCKYIIPIFVFDPYQCDINSHNKNYISFPVLKFICESLPCSMLGMNSALMSQYIRFVSDRLLVSLGYNKLWNESNPFDFMESISMEGKTNFFESRPTQYQKASVLNTGRDTSFEVTDDF